MVKADVTDSDINLLTQLSLSTQATTTNTAIVQNKYSGYML